MIEFVVWLVAVELLGLAALPLTLAALPRLADRGYGLAKLVGILVVTYLNYLLGSLLGQGNNAPLLIVGAVVLCAGGLALLRPELADLPSWFRQHRTALLVEEGLFALLFVLWALVRAAHPGILSTEKPMDLALMTASHKATSFPPYDPWLAGTTINYYYGGYLAVGTLVTLAGVSATVGYNLALALLFALVGGAAYSVAYGLARSPRWALLGPLFVLLVGNLDGLIQYLNHGTAAFDFFNSSRVVHNGYNIDEFPVFSFLLGDLHPHVIALPFTILAIGIALNLALASAAGWDALARTDALRATTMALAALSAGALYFMNSWDWPTYLLLIGAALLLPGLVSLDRRALVEGVGVAVGVALLSYLLYVSFHRDFKPQYSSFGLRLHGSPVSDVFVMFGLFLLPVAAFIVGYLPGGRRLSTTAPPITPAAMAATAGTAAPRGAARGVARGAATGSSRAAMAVLDREPEDGALDSGRGAETATVVDGGDVGDDLPRLPMPSLGALGGPRLLVVAATLTLALLLHFVVGLSMVGLLLPFLGAALYLATREANAGGRETAFALLLCAGGLGLIALCDAVFLKDLFCQPDVSGACTGVSYRMNTVFKFYYQAWTLLALGAAYGLYALSRKLRLGWRRFVAPGAAIAIAAAGGVYLALALFAPGSDLDTYTKPVANAAPTLDGAAYLDSYSGPPITITNAIPADAAAIRWLNANVHGHPTILEADQILHSNGTTGPQDYWPYPGTADCVTRSPATPDWVCQEELMYRISTFTGLPTILGSGGSHEGLWHSQGEVDARFADLQTIYTSADPAAIGALLRKYNVSYIYVGGNEKYSYYGGDAERVSAALARFKKFGAVVYNKGGVTIVRTSF